MILVLMGVSGCGKTTIGEHVAQRLACEYQDADSFHSQANIDKMHRGMPLDDDDRAPWLAAIRQEIEACHRDGRTHVFGCSALRQRYRDVLSDHGRDRAVVFVHLAGSFELIRDRLAARTDHFFDAKLLRSQFDALEVPADAITVSIDQSVEDIVNEILRRLPAADQDHAGGFTRSDV
ncbi:gluconokinase [Pigmentiphaga aceris]|uniref:Gluconokinase n=1 Tax=Pigmentiphaga aceris TaxID=1940612 RepID=A0A5C0AUL7_9BURK|nr:gluconokinase [Pigmentiphaga aceris]QEI06008.1 gluconokinase [Pigmentiphaga aceris]